MHTRLLLNEAILVLQLKKKYYTVGTVPNSNKNRIFSFLDSVFVILSVLILPLCCMSLFDLRILSSPYVTSDFSNQLYYFSRSSRSTNINW